MRAKRSKKIAATIVQPTMGFLYFLRAIPIIIAKIGNPRKRKISKRNCSVRSSSNSRGRGLMGSLIPKDQSIVYAQKASGGITNDNAKIAKYFFNLFFILLY